MRRKITQSSLPDSLIPHLYSAPQQPAPTLNHNDDDDNDDEDDRRQLQPDQNNIRLQGPSVAPRPIYSDPMFYSSNARLPSIARRGSSLPPPPRLTPPPAPLLQQQNQLHHQLHHSYHDRPLPPPRAFLRDYEDSYTSSMPALASLSISAPTASSSAFSRFPDSPESHQPEDSHRPNTPTNNPRDGSRKGKKRKSSPDPDDDNTRKSRNPRKTLVACNFCRGRKLRCNGARPACYNCSIRNAKKCEYVPVQRRRGPGRAPRGSRARRAGQAASRASQSASRSDPAVSTTGSSNITYELETLAPEVRPYTSVMTFDPPNTTFTFRPPTPPRQPPPPPPPLPQPTQAGPSSGQISQHSQHHFSFSSGFHQYIQQHPHNSTPQHQQQQHQHHYHNDPYHHHGRTPRSQETSSEDLEDRSEIDEFYRRRRYGS
ncbi:hypothetical protein BJ165DRAFT_1527670 [Panaeolus papilionaceus]|nr:hypothetical protein BJ165DRAFT_1527670 [Panaeolus papilionaceus]